MTCCVMGVGNLKQLETGPGSRRAFIWTETKRDTARLRADAGEEFADTDFPTSVFVYREIE